MTRDMGRRIRELADALTPEQIDELMAIAWFDIAGDESRTPTLMPKIREWEFYPLVRAGVLWLGPPPADWCGGRYWRTPNLTKLGKYVLHARCEDELRKAGAIPPEVAGGGS